MIRQTLNRQELDSMLEAMETHDEELDIEILDEDYDSIGDNELYEYDEYDGQPDEYTEWQDFMGGDEYYDHSENCLGDY